jgi:glycosyltransferase involved in cell wall biosynthesis
MTSISFVIPAYNESKRILSTVQQIVKVIEDLNLENSEIIIIDDNSADTTPDEIENIKKKYLDIIILSHRNKKNLGFGGAIKKGLKLATKEKVLWLPGDNSHSSNEIKKILNERSNKYNIISTYYINTENRAFIRRLFTGLYTPVLNFLFGLDLPYYNGLSLIEKKIISAINIQTNSHSWQVELWVKSRHIKNFNYKFVPTILQDRIIGATAFKLNNSVKVFYNIIRLIFVNLYLITKSNLFNKRK